MTDDRLVAELAAWLQDRELPPPDTRLSASRVMAGVSGTSQLGPWWPPVRFARRARPAPAAGGRIAVPPPVPYTKKGVLATFTATRVAVAMLVLALATTGLFAGRWLLPEPVEPLPAITSPSPSAEPTAEPTPEPTRGVESTSITATSAFAASQVIAELPDGSDPVQLVPSPPHRPGAVFIDRATEAVMHAEDDGELRVLMQQDLDDGARTMAAAPAVVELAGDQLLVVDADGGVHQWGHWRDAGRVMSALGTSWGEVGELARLDPFAIYAATMVEDSEFDLRAVDAADGALTLAQARYRRGPRSTVERNGREFDVPGVSGLILDEPHLRIQRTGGDATDLEVAGPTFVSTSRDVERYEDGRLDESWSLALPDGLVPDFQFMSATGDADAGQLWLYDAAGELFVVFDKSDGSYIGAWAPTAYPLDDVRGMYVIAGADGDADSITWLTATAVVRAALEHTRALQPHATPAPKVTGRLTPSDRSAGKRSIDWSDGGVEFKADDLVIRVKGHDPVRPPDGVYVNNHTYADQAELEAEWHDENGRYQRVYAVIRADDADWWIDWIWVYDGEKSGEWIEFRNLERLTRTPLGQSLVGDLRLESTNSDRKKYDAPGSAVLRIVGLKMSALQPGTRPAPLTGCTPYEDERFSIDLEKAWDDENDTWSTGYGGKILRGSGEPLEGMKANKMTPKEVESILEDLGICYRFRHEWRTWVELHDGSRIKDYAYDFRCSAPDTGKVIGLTPGPGYPAEDGSAVIYIHVREPKVRDWPEPPPAGTDCPTQ